MGIPINSPLVKWLAGGISVPMLFTGIVWAVDVRIEQKTSPQIQQLRKDVITDIRQERIDYLQMKKTAGIISNEERIELEYLLERK